MGTRTIGKGKAKGSEGEEKGDENTSPRFTNVKEQNRKEKEISIEKGGKVIKSTGKCGMALVTSREGFKKGSISYVRVKRVGGNAFWQGLGILEKYDSAAFSFSNDRKCVLSYFYYGGGTINWCKGGMHWEALQKAGVRWGLGETVKMKVDLVKFEVSFHKNENIIGNPVRIKEREVYYPGLQIMQEAIVEIIP